MKKALQVIFWFLIAILTAHTLTSCEKSEPPLNWYLDISFLDYRAGNMPAKSIGDNIGADGSVIGQSMDFENESLRCRLFTSGGVVTQLTGLYDGKPFILIDDSVNICSGEQRVPITYSLNYR